MTKMHPALVIQQENGCASNPHPIGIYSSLTLKSGTVHSHAIVNACNYRKNACHDEQDSSSHL
jgi:hypothetical protein